eukprot:TRINITY_DN6979_c0_g2_i2.p1 TRINITY_DN6979_c0_g2~~TRINITY_DN6979_c0_g2_i2.p1  ORF type:complete len:138 (+),score=20.30 TRINITY_DN6979_c0_g2_i2:959-1372(+)
MKSPDSSISISEITAQGAKGIRLCKPPADFNFNSGCAGIAFSSKEPVFEPFAQSSNKLSAQEVDKKIVKTVVQNMIAVPIFDENNNSTGVFEAINSDKAIFTDNKKPLLARFAKYISLLYYTNSLLTVLSLSELRTL